MFFFAAYLLLGVFVGAEECNHGPYLFDDSCAIVSQGIGSSMNRMKYGLLLSHLYNMTYVPNRKCFQSKEHHTDLYDYFGWENHLDCTYRQILEHTHSHHVVQSNTGDTSSSGESNDGDGHGDGNGSHIHLQKLARLRDTNSPTFANESRKLVLVPVHYSNQREIESVDNQHLETLCVSLSHLRPSLDLDTARVVNYFRAGNEQKAEKILSKLQELSSGEKTQNHVGGPQRTLFPQLQKATVEVAQFEGIDPSKVVYILKAPRLIEGYRCSGAYIYEHWRNAPSRLTTKAVKPIREKLVFVFNLRHGDVATRDINWIDPQYETRTIPLKQGIDVMTALFSEGSVLYQKQHLVDVHFYSEGNTDEFQPLIQAFPDIHMHLGNADSTMSDIDGMSQADIFLTSPSSFCALIASLNRDGVILIDDENSNKFDGIDTLRQQKILKKDFTEFNKQLCAAKLYIPSTLKEQICGKSETSTPDSNKDTSKGSNVEGTSDKSRRIFNAYRRVLSTLDTSETTASQPFSLSSLVSALKAEPDLKDILSALSEVQANTSVSCYRDPKTAYSRDYYIQGSICRTNKYTGPRMVYKQGDVGLTPGPIFRYRRNFLRRHLLEQQEYTVDGKRADRSLELSLAYITRLVADVIIQTGFQMSTYVVFGGNTHRKERLIQHLAHSGIDESYRHWIDVYKANEITADVKAAHFKNDDDASKARCIEVFEMDRACGKAVKGYDFSKTEMSVALKHMTIMKELHAYESKRREGTTGDDSTILDSFVLVIEDDQFLPLDIRRQVVELLLQAPGKLSSVMLDDSFFWIPGYAPPPSIGKFVFPRSYYRDNTRTVGAYLIRYSAAHGIIENHSFIPAYAPIDHQLKYALRSNQQLIHWAYPPLTCAGSQGLEGLHTSATGGTQMDPGDRIACMHCCDRFYNMTTMDNLYQFALKN